MEKFSLNPRFDGAFLNWQGAYQVAAGVKVLIPDLMGLF